MTAALWTLGPLAAGYLATLPWRRRAITWLGTHLDPAP
jgi:hypothetical protein